MVLPLLIIILIASQLYFRFSAVTELDGVSHLLHKICLNQIPQATISNEPLSALVCGKNFESLSSKQLYAASGLIHLFVVSGSHLIIIQNILERLLKSFSNQAFKHILFFLLFTYCAMCLFNPPVLRSFIYLLTSHSLRQKHYHWPKHYVLLLAGLTTVAANYDWITSLSLQMSWLAALALEVHSQKFKNTSVIFRQIIFYLLFLCSFMVLGFPQASVIIVCVVLTPVLEYVLFPAALLTALIHNLEPFFSVLITTLNQLLFLLEFQSTPSQFNYDLLIQINWLLILTIHLWLFSRNEKT